VTSVDEVRLVVLWSRPDDLDAFEQDYAENHLPLADRLPGVLAVSSCRLRSREQHRMAELRFADAESMRAAMGSPAGVRLAADADRLASTYGVTATNLVTIPEETR
jgi:uncharacterized protein (TIGR02118 family)